MRLIDHQARIAILAAVVVAFATTNAALRVPPPGKQIPAEARSELAGDAARLSAEISTLRRDLANDSPLRRLLPDVEIFLKAIDWPLRYDEFFRSNDVVTARRLLKQGFERVRELRAGNPSWINATGLVVRGYVSRIDGSVQPYGLVVPATFRADPSRARRLDVWLHGRDNELTELKFLSDRQRSAGEFAPADTFVLHPYGRYCNAFKFAGETDVIEALEDVGRNYSIDARRVAIRGFSMGGAGTWHLAAHHPEIWAAAAPGAGFAETAQYMGALNRIPPPPPWEQTLWQLYDASDYAANFSMIPVLAYNGTEDKQRQAADVMEKALAAEGMSLMRVWGTNVGHKYTAEAKQEISRIVDRAVAAGKSAPARLHFTTRTLRYNAFDGGEVLTLAEHWRRADLIVERPANGITQPLVVLTTNVTAFTLRRDFAGYSTAIVDGQRIGIASRKNSPATFLRDATGRWSTRDTFSVPSHAKVHGLQGPIDDAFMDSFLMVRPTGAPARVEVGRWIAAAMEKATNDWRAQFRGDALVKDDAQVTDADIAAHNLVVWGDPQSNQLLARAGGKLPIRWTSEELRVGDHVFDPATHVPVLIFPNPLNPKRYIVINSGFTFAAAGAGSNAEQTPKLPDFAVLKLDTAQPVLAGFFDEQWQLPVLR